VKIKVKRGGSEPTLVIAPEVLKETGSRGLGVEMIDVGTVRFPWYLAPVRGAQATAYMLWAIVVSFYGLLAGLFTGRGLSADVSGLSGIAVVTGQAVQFGFAYLVEFMALLSLNLAVVNAVPFPALDGGRFLFLVIEAVRRRPVSRRLEGIVHQIGFAVLMLLVVAVTYRDLVRYGSTITGFFKGLI
jgi:Predicted membrane-associated Zn-dependent proteases 1